MDKRTLGDTILTIKRLRNPSAREALFVLYRYRILTITQLAVVMLGFHPTRFQRACLAYEIQECIKLGLITPVYGRSAYILTPLALQVIPHMASYPYLPARPLELTSMRPELTKHHERIAAHQMLMALITTPSDYYTINRRTSWGQVARMQMPKLAPLKPDLWCDMRSRGGSTLLYVVRHHEGDLQNLSHQWRTALNIRADYLCTGGDYHTNSPTPACIIATEHPEQIKNIEIPDCPQTGPYLVSAAHWRINPHMALITDAGNGTQHNLADILTYHSRPLRASSIYYPTHLSDPYPQDK